MFRMDWRCVASIGGAKDWYVWYGYVLIMRNNRTNHLPNSPGTLVFCPYVQCATNKIQ